MGGIKNKLAKKLPNKTIPLSDYRLTSPFSQRGTKSSLPLAKGRQMSVAHRWGRITKYLGITCLTLAILSILVLNIVSSYSSSSIESNAETASATLSNDATALANSSSLSISFSNATGSCTDTSNPANICMEIPDNGGIATGGHTVTINTADGTDYELTISGKEEEAALVNNDDSAVVIPTISGGYSGDVESVLTSESSDVAWAYSTSVASGDGTNSWYTYPLLGSSSPTVVLNGQSGKNSVDVRYGAKVADSTKMRAGNYSTNVVYTVTAKVPPATLSNLIQNDTLLTGQQKEFAVQGTNLGTATRVKLCHADDQYLCYVTDDVTTYPGTDQAETIMSFITPDVDITGVYDVIVETAGGEARLDDSLRVIKQSVCMNGVNADSDCQVDIDDNMIPIRYTGNNPDGSAIWVTVSDNEIDHNPGLWYDYGKKQWANTVTVTSSSLSKYKNKSQVTVNESDVLGYWVYIPRYAYEVQRRDATDHFVRDEYPLPDNTVVGTNTSINTHALKNDFIIQFETFTTLPKTPATSCNAWRSSSYDMWLNNKKPTDNSGQSGLVLAGDYRTECGINREYGTSNTTWGTHPAFSFGDAQLNGIWVGKFETTGYVSTEPTVKPNMHAYLGSNEDGYYVAGLYDISKSIGVYDSANSGGGGRIPVSRNCHGLSTATSHMTKSLEWGAALYLALSYYGAGVNEVQPNTAEGNRYALDDPLDEYVSDGVTGCGPNDDGNYTAYDTDEANVGNETFCGNAKRSYSGEIGALSSTTNNIYGVYGMAGGADDFVAGNISSSNNVITDSDGRFGSLVRGPYVDLYKKSDGFNGLSFLTGPLATVLLQQISTYVHGKLAVERLSTRLWACSLL